MCSSSSLGRRLALGNDDEFRLYSITRLGSRSRDLIDLSLQLGKLLVSKIRRPHGASVPAQVMDDAVGGIGLAEDEQRSGTRLQIIAQLLAEDVEIVARAALSELPDVGAYGCTCRNAKHRNQEDRPNYSTKHNAAYRSAPHRVTVAVMDDFSVRALRDERRVEDFQVSGCRHVGIDNRK
jgi:hypothetical protein